MNTMRFVQEEKYPPCPLLQDLFDRQEGFWMDDEGNFDHLLDLNDDWIASLVPNQGQKKQSADSEVDSGGKRRNGYYLWATNPPVLLSMAFALEVSLRQGGGVYYDGSSVLDPWFSVISEFSLTKQAFGEEKDGKFEFFSKEVVMRKLYHLKNKTYR